MYRSTWELETYVHHHIAEIADERRACAPITPSVDGLTRPMTQLRLRLGIGLIKVGHALAGYETGRALPASPPQPAAWGSGS